MGRPVSHCTPNTLCCLRFPHPELVTVDVVGRNGPAFFLGCLMFNFVTQLGQLVTEKELHLRSALRTNGMKSSVYWFTWLVINMMWNFITSVIIVLLGAILQVCCALRASRLRVLEPALPACLTAVTDAVHPYPVPPPSSTSSSRTTPAPTPSFSSSSASRWSVAQRTGSQIPRRRC